MSDDKVNAWWAHHSGEITNYYCGDCGEECDDSAIVTTKTKPNGSITIQSITCKNCTKKGDLQDEKK